MDGFSEEEILAFSGLWTGNKAGINSQACILQECLIRTDSLLNNSKKATDAEFVGNVLRIYLETVKRHKLICQVFPKE